MTVAGSVVASTYLPPREHVAPSGKRMISPIAVPHSLREEGSRFQTERHLDD